MTNKEELEIRRKYNSLYFTSEEENALHECYMSGVNRDGHTWVTWTSVQKLMVDLCDWKGRLHDD